MNKNIKKFLTVIITIVVTLTMLTGCKEKETAGEVSVPGVAETHDETDTSTGVKTIVVYFSATGHTEPLAVYIAECLDADIYRIVPVDEYTDEDLNYNKSSSRTSKEQNDDSARPAIGSELPDLSEYGTILIGHPIWWGKAPRIILTFLEGYDLSGKTVTSFCTSASSPLGKSAEELRETAGGDTINWLDSRRFPVNADKETVLSWLTEIGLI